MAKKKYKGKKKYTGLGKSGYGKILRRKKGESIKSFAKRQKKEYSK
jgi:hypothetical protein